MKTRRMILGTCIACMTCITGLTGILAAIGGGSRAQNRPASEQQRALPASVRSVLDNSQQFTVYALRSQRSSHNARDGRSFHGYPIVRQRQITRARQKAQLLSALYRGIADPKAGPKECFVPHHGLRAVRDGKMVDLVICFRCDTAHVYIGQQQGQQQERLTIMPISDIPNPLLDQALR